MSARQFGLNVGHLKRFWGCFMKKFVCFAMMACLGLFAQQAQAGVLSIAGTTSSATSAFNNLAWSLNVVYTPNLTGAAAGISSGVFQLGARTLNVNTANSGDTITVTIDPGVNDDRLVIAFDTSASGTILFAAV
ncbi:MAG: hypothetical protein ACKPHU_01185, partial [Planctomycetaceae bacterium]